MTYSVRNIVIAVVLAVLAAVLVIMYTSNAQKQATDGQVSTTVLVAKTDIAPGTEVSTALTAGAFETRSVVAKDVVPGALTSLNSLDKSLAATGQIAAGSQITSSMFSASQQNPIVTQISGVDRAIQFALNPNAVLGGTLKAGDHVDIIYYTTIHPTGNNSKYGDTDVSRLLFLNVPVLSTYDSGAAETAIAADSQGPDSGGSTDGTSGLGVIVKLPQTQVGEFLLALSTGRVWFALRPATGAKDSPGYLNTACSLMSQGLTTQQIHHQIPSCPTGGK
jgi:Flp pilus assembly protein CpaB